MAGIVDVNGNELFNKFDFESWSIEERLEFLEKAIELRLKNLDKHIDPKFIASVTVISKRMNLPLCTSKNIKYIKDLYEIDSVEFEKALSEIEFEFYGAIESTAYATDKYYDEHRAKY